MTQSPVLYTIDDYTAWMIANDFWPVGSRPKDPAKYTFPMVAVGHRREGKAPLVERVYVGPLWQDYDGTWEQFVNERLANEGTLVATPRGTFVIGTSNLPYIPNETYVLRYARIWSR